MPLAKYVALHYGQLTFPFRRFQIGKVYRGERAQRGRFREFYQADIDIIGDGSLDIINEAEIPGIIYKTFSALGLKRFIIRINNRKVLNGFFRLIGVGDRAGDVMRTIDKLDKIGADKVRTLLIEETGLSADTAEKILDLISCRDRGEDPLEALGRYQGQDPTLDEGISELTVVTRYLEQFGVPQDHFMIDLTIARGLDYYTGTVYETTLPDHPEIGSICSGGRYDDLAGYYTDRRLPGVGISIGLTRLFFVLEDQNYLNPALTPSPADVLILPMTEDLGPAIAFATELRNAGIRAQLHCEKKKFKQKMAYADRLGVPYVAFLGEDEIRSGRVTVKNMATGEQIQVSPAMAVAGIQEKIKETRLVPPIGEPAKH